MIKETFELITKNFKLILRSKMSVLMLVLVPALLIFLLGLAFGQSSSYTLSMGIYSEKYSELTNSFVDQLNENNFRVTKYNAEWDCIEAIKDGKSNICVKFPPDMEIKEGVTNEVVFHVDYSKINLVWMVLDTISAKLSVKSEEISMNLTQILIDRLKETTIALNENKAVINSIKEENKKLNDANVQINKKLGDLDLTINLDEFGIAGTKSNLDALKGNFSEQLTSLNAAVTTAKNSLAGSSTIEPSVKASIDSALDSIDSDIDSIDMLVVGTASAGNNINKIKELLENIDANLTGVKTRMDAASSARTDIIKQIDDAQKIVESSKLNIDKLGKAFDDMITRISGIQVTSASNIVSPIKTTITPIIAQTSHLNYIYAGIVVLIIMFVSILLASTIVMIEKKSKSYLLNYLTPTSDFAFVISTMITIIILMIIQVAIIIGISAYFYQAQVVPNLATISVVLLVSTLMFILLGMCIAYLFKAEQTVTLATIGIGSIFLFLSDIILPIESMPIYVQNIIQFNPFLLSELMLKKAILFNASIPSMWRSLTLLGIYALVLFIIILFTEKLVKRHSLFAMFRALMPFKKRKP